MAVNTLVKFVQGATVGTPGVALIGVAGTAVTVSNGGTNPSPDPGTWTFTVLGVPSGSAVPTGIVQTGSTQTWTFTPDVPGCYIVQLQVTDNTTAATSTQALAFGIYTGAIGGVSYLIPAFTGNNLSMNFSSQTTGWDVFMEAWLNLLWVLAAASGNVQKVVSTTTVTVQPGQYLWVPLSTIGASVTVTPATPWPAFGGYGVKLVGNNGSYTCTLNTTSGSAAYEGRLTPGVLGTNGTAIVMSANGDELNWRSPDGANFYQ